MKKNERTRKRRKGKKTQSCVFSDSAHCSVASFKAKGKKNRMQLIRKVCEKYGATLCCSTGWTDGKGPASPLMPTDLHDLHN